jgi:hypothetical protein
MNYAGRPGGAAAFYLLGDAGLSRSLLIPPGMSMH